MIATGQTLKSTEEVKGRSLWVDARRRLLKNRAAMASLIILLNFLADIAYGILDPRVRLK